MSRQCEYCGADISHKRRGQSFCGHDCFGASASKNPNLRHSFFSAPNINNSYWAGFIAADGWVQDQNRGQDRISITLSQRDREHLEKLALAIGATTINDFTARSYGQDRIFSRISFVSNELSNDLAGNFNITPKKSLTLEPPELDDEECRLAFIAGYIDGDGSYAVDYKQNKPKLIAIGTYPMCKYIGSTLGCKNKIRDKGNQSEIVFNNSHAVLAREKYIHMKVPFLKSKYRRWESLGVDLGVFHSKERVHGQNHSYPHVFCRCNQCGPKRKSYLESLEKNEVGEASKRSL